MAGPAGHQWGAAGGQIFAVSHQGGVRGVEEEGGYLSGVVITLPTESIVPVVVFY